MERGHYQHTIVFTEAQIMVIAQVLAMLQQQLHASDATPISAPAPSAVTDFDAFWIAFPRKIGKGAAEMAWKKLKPDAGLQRQILDAVKAQCRSEQWTREQGRFVPHPATWLNQKRWDDEVEVTCAKTGPPVMYKTLPKRDDGEPCPPEAKAIISRLLGKDFSL